MILLVIAIALEITFTILNGALSIGTGCLGMRSSENIARTFCT
jgi:hypothetical protein